MQCQLCAFRCGVNRAQQLGVCQIDSGLYVAAVCQHRGEEPVLGNGLGVCNVFFAHCNLQCCFCQNCQISSNALSLASYSTNLPTLVERISACLRLGLDTLGLVSPTPYVPWIPPLIEALHRRGLEPTVVYNTNGYETPQAIESLKGLVDIYLPDYKYGSYALAKELSRAPRYPDVALEAIQAMAAQVGVGLQLDARGSARRGLIVRHLVLPGYLDNSKAALVNLATELSPDIYLSLLAQYVPFGNVTRFSNLQRRLTQPEYDEVAEYAYGLGFSHGWTQELSSAAYYAPDFTKPNPFEH